MSPLHEIVRGRVTRPPTMRERSQRPQPATAHCVAFRTYPLFATADVQDGVAPKRPVLVVSVWPHALIGLVVKLGTRGRETGLALYNTND